ncbi:MAG TPA: polysaccharide deacetylase family protein [Planctomycetota bacterium]|nr:polysaccharide deacetylase family protein [Planctomycetota bacterium]
MSRKVAEIAKHAYRAVGLPLLGMLGGFALLRRIRRDSALVLMYHSVIDTCGDRGLLTNVNQVDTGSFRWQVWFLKNHYEVVRLSTIVERIRNRKPVTGLAAITFDDGYLSVFESAAPILHAYNLPATVFLIAGLVDKDEMTWYDKVEAHLLNTSVSKITIGAEDYHLDGERETAIRAVKHRLGDVDLEARERLVAELVGQAGELEHAARKRYRLMGWREVERLREQGFDFGVHSYSHPHLTKVPSRSLQLEIDASAKLISDRLHVPIETLVFCYPHGDYDDRVRDRVIATGMLGAMGVKHDLTPPDGDPFALPRVGVSRDQTRAMFMEATVGLSAWLKRRIPT